jgi:hypothetical protein
VFMALVSAALGAEPALDLSRAVTMNSAASMGMGSAGIGFASGSRGLFFHPAAPSVRPAEARGAWGVVVTLNMSAFLRHSGIEAEELGLHESAWVGVTLNTGVALRYKNGGGGIAYSTLVQGSEGRWITTTEGHAVGSWAIPAWKAVFGAGSRIADAEIETPGGRRYYRGSGLQTGFMLADLVPDWNLAMCWRQRIEAPAVSGPLEGVPELAVMPWELGFGAAWMGGSPAFMLAQRPMRAAFDVQLEGPVSGGLAVESVALGEELARGATMSLSVRTGVELEVIPDYLRVRTGTWVEPDRTGLARGRIHGTGGLETRLFEVPGPGGRRVPVSLSLAFDRSGGYTHLKWLALGIWRSGVVGVPYGEGLGGPT